MTKKYFFLGLFLLVTLVSAHPQATYYPTLRKGIKWKLYIVNYKTVNDKSFSSIIPLSTQDTIIGGVGYNQSYFENLDQSFYQKKNVFVREDTAQKRIYFTLDKPQNERILYDYSLNIGDTLDDTKLGKFKFIVDSISSINTFEGNRNVWYLHILGKAGIVPGIITWIQGIGSLAGPFYLVYNDGNNQQQINGHNIQYPGLICARLDSQEIYYSSQLSYLFPNCDSNTYLIYFGVSDIDSKNFALFPNPIHDYIMLSHQGYFDNNYAFSIYTIDGRFLKIEEKIIEQDNIRIDLPNLPSGLYFLNILSKYSNTTYKFIKE